MERKLASVQEVKSLSPIEGADLIEVAAINGWKLVVKKGEFNVGDKAVYCEIDSYLPICDDFEFLRKSSYKKIGEQEGFRLKTIKLRGQVSQGLLLPLNILKSKIYKDHYDKLAVGDDVTEALQIWKYDPPIPAQLAGVAKGSFPSFIPKTDEERIQNLSIVYENFKKSIFYVTEKLDGSSATFYYNNGTFGVCSRNLELLPSEDNSFWKFANACELECKLKKLDVNISIQGELVGEGIRSNPYKLKGQTVFFFNAFNIDEQKYYSYEEMLSLLRDLSLKTVPIVELRYKLPDTIEELLLFADGKSVLNPSANREGVVVRNHARTISFKAISNQFLLKES